MSKSAKLDRLLQIMARWWDGWSWAQIADEHSISRQRVGRLLAHVGCTRALRERADHHRPASRRRRAMSGHTSPARDALLRACAGRLTMRQRAALAWTAMGLGTADTARRMATTPTNVRGLMAAAHRRLDQISRPQGQKRSRLRAGAGAPCTISRFGEDGMGIDWDPLVSAIDAQGAVPNS